MSGRRVTSVRPDWLCLPPLSAVIRLGVVVVVAVIVIALVGFGFGVVVNVIVATTAIVEAAYRSMAIGRRARRSCRRRTRLA